MNTPFIDLSTQYALCKSSIDRAILDVLEHGQYIMGPEVSELERQLADHIGVKHVLACSSGTDALLLALMAKNIESTDVIFTTPFTFFASAESISLAGATPVFVDIDPDTYNIDPQALEIEIERVISEGKFNPKGILAVDLFGIAADYHAINSIAEKFGLFVIEDAAQSYGANYHGKKACGLAHIGTTSFYPAKPLGCYGDGGAVFTNDTEIYEQLVSLRVHGQNAKDNKYDNVRIGLNARMDTIQAAILLEKLKIYDQEILERNRVANSYTSKLDVAVKTPTIPNDQGSVWAQYSVQSVKREEIREALHNKGIPTAVFYPTPIHLSTAYKFLGYSTGDFPVCESISDKIFSLPMHPYLKEEQIAVISNTLKSVL